MFLVYFDLFENEKLKVGFTVVSPARIIHKLYYARWDLPTVTNLFNNLTVTTTTTMMMTIKTV
jgi:hypothetical protein